MVQAMTMVVLLVSFFALYGIMPRSGTALKLYLTLLSFLAFTTVLVHYLSLLAQPVAISVYPLLIVEKWQGNQVMAIDWGQVVMLFFIVSLRSALKSLRNQEQQKTIVKEVQGERGESTAADDRGEDTTLSNQDGYKI